MTAAAARAAGVSAGGFDRALGLARGGRGTFAGAAGVGADQTVAARNDATDGLAGFRMLRERSVLHALLELELADTGTGLLRDGLVNVRGHGVKGREVVSALRWVKPDEIGGRTEKLEV